MKIELLLIDNDEDELDIFNEALLGLEFDCNCTYASSARTALNLIPGQKFDVIFIDINMPSISGYECLDLIKNDQPLNTARLVMYSTGLDKAEQAKAIRLGADFCLRKTSTISELSKSLSTIIEQCKAS